MVARRCSRAYCRRFLTVVSGTAAARRFSLRVAGDVEQLGHFALRAGSARTARLTCFFQVAVSALRGVGLVARPRLPAQQQGRFAARWRGGSRSGRYA